MQYFAPTLLDRQVFTASGTWVNLVSGGLVRIRAMGAGGGGGAGRRSAAATVCGGGGGGGGGAYVEAFYLGAELLPSYNVQVTAGGAGAPSVTVDNTNGASGSAGAAGGNSSVSGGLIVAKGGTGGIGGGIQGASSPVPGGQNGNYTTAFAFVNTTGISPPGAGGWGGGDTAAAGPFALEQDYTGLYGRGGGGGGGITAAGVAKAGAQGEFPRQFNGALYQFGQTGGANGVSGLISSTPSLWDARFGHIPNIGGNGGGGGNPSASPGGNGAPGAGYGAGGGGGGGSVNGQASGAGGAGAPGLVIIEVFS